MHKRIYLRLPGHRNLQRARGVALLACALITAGTFQNVCAAARTLPLGARTTSAETVGQAPEPTSGGVTDQQSTGGTNSGAQATRQTTDQFRLSRERYEKAIAYSRARYTLHFVSVAWGIVVLIVLLRMQVVAKLRDFAEAKSR